MTVVAVRALSRGSLVGAILLLCSCSLGPDYRRPSESEAGVPAAWKAALPHAGSLRRLAAWWESFDDPALARLVLAAESNNPTIAGSIAKVREARAYARSSRSSLLPSVSGSGSLLRGRNLGGGTTTQETDLASETAGLASGSLDAAWELDLFGKNRRAVEAAEARRAAAEAEWHDARITLAAEVASVYISYREGRLLLDLLGKELESRRRTEGLVALKIGAGLAPPSDLLSVRAASAQASGRMEDRTRLCAQAANQLVMLTALDFGEVQAVLGSSAAIPGAKYPIEPAVPARTLSQRPDVRAAEGLLAAACADIGFAKGEALPSLSLLGSIGASSVRSSGARSTTRSWSFGPSLEIPLFDAGANAANIEAARARYDRAFASYRARVSAAVREVEDALVAVETSARRARCARSAADDREALRAATERRRSEGASSLLESEDSLRQGLEAQAESLSANADQARSWIALYKALGGGWQTEAQPAPAR